MVTVVQILRIKIQYCENVIEFPETLIKTFHIRDNSMDSSKKKK